MNYKISICLAILFLGMLTIVVAQGYTGLDIILEKGEKVEFDSVTLIDNFSNGNVLLEVNEKEWLFEVGDRRVIDNTDIKYLLEDDGEVRVILTPGRRITLPINDGSISNEELPISGLRLKAEPLSETSAELFAYNDDDELVGSTVIGEYARRGIIGIGGGSALDILLIREPENTFPNSLDFNKLDTITIEVSPAVRTELREAEALEFIGEVFNLSTLDLDDKFRAFVTVGGRKIELSCGNDYPETAQGFELTIQDCRQEQSDGGFTEKTAVLTITKSWGSNDFDIMDATDIDRNRQVDVDDLNLVGRFMGRATSTVSSTFSKVDVNDDGIVNIFDLVLVSEDVPEELKQGAKSA